MGHTAGYYYIGLNPTLAFDTSVPFGLNARQQAAWLLSAGGMELMREVYGEYNVVNFPGGNTGTQMGGWFQKEINQLSDLVNLRMRIPGLGGKVMSDLGVNVQNLAGGEVLDALQKKVIDAAEWVGPYDDLKLGFNRVAKFYYYPGWWEPGPALSFVVNRNSFEKLPTDYQAAIGAACAEASTRMMADYDAKNPQALKTLMESGVQLREYPADVMKAAEEKTAARLDSLAAESPQFKKVFEHWNAYKKESTSWFNLAERSFSNFSA
jgi:TRAP-type mannitol/chloroaromatic compound transport system substrate-binding protein